MSKAKLTPEGWRCDKEKDHLLRAKWLDFRSPAIHQLTMVSTDRSPLFGKLIVPDNDTNRAFIERTPLGNKIAEEIERIPTYIGASSIEIYTYIVMPDHIHVLLHVHDRLPKHLGQYVRWFKRQCTSAGLTLGTISPSSPVSQIRYFSFFYKNLHFFIKYLHIPKECSNFAPSFRRKGRDILIKTKY